MEIHFYESKKVYPIDKEIIHDWESVTEAIEANVPEIHTTQMCELSTTWMVRFGYRLFVHQGNGIVYEVTIINENNKGKRAIRMSQNAYKMWASDVFRE